MLVNQAMRVFAVAVDYQDDYFVTLIQRLAPLRSGTPCEVDPRGCLMRYAKIRLLRNQLAVLCFAIAALVSPHSLALPTHTLTSGEWSLISIPADPGSDGSVQRLFGDDLPVADYGATGDWVIFALNATTGTYEELGITDTLTANTGYWMIQLVRDSVTLDVPDSLSPLNGSDIPGCPTDQNCFARSLTSNGSDTQWNLVGFSAENALTFGDTRFQSANAACIDGCTPAQAFAATVVGNVMFRYAGANAASPYETITEASVMQPWDGFWLPVLSDAQAPVWVLPVADRDNPLGADEQDAVRLLMQASFGPSEPSIEQVLQLGGPAAWIDAQLELPAELHLPMVNQLYPNRADNQEGRYTTFWERALRADDQLRQRVAFALSEIMVISDRNTILLTNGNMVTAYYDVLVRNALGNYRDLIEDVTLNPAMGIYLSMIGNDRPDDATGRRADENYARELMQLFSIGLVDLNLNGTEVAGTSTYSQSDVENLARAFTGWSWDVDAWDVSPRNGWRPNRSTMERPMVAFPAHHDVESKRILGTTIPANQTPAADLNDALNIIFNHPNVGPFIGKQLIQRLVTSNPTPAYVQRVASVFNNNGRGTRGDLGAVVRAILLDEEARSPAASARTDFGKLRESIFRYTHLWRSFEMVDPINIHHNTTQHIPLISPLTAPSVFNFFSPSYSPPGAMFDANLVGPEFQINSETNLNSVNSVLIRMVLFDTFQNNTTTLNLQNERLLLSDTNALLDHLDRLLLAGNLSNRSRQVLTNYINNNRGTIDDERLLRDVIGLVVTSTEYAVQR